MNFDLAEEDKFEIIVILREELHKKMELGILRGDSGVITQLGKIDFERSVISGRGDIVPEKVQCFTLHNESGIIRFSVRFEQTSSTGAEAELPYFIPDMIFFTWQRQSQRFSSLKGYDFFCFGRYKNGENYPFRIKSISQGGCALIVKDIDACLLYEDAVTKNASPDFDTFGSLQLDLKAIDAVLISKFDEDDQSCPYHQISCEFDSKNRREEIEIEKVIIRFLTSNKIRSLQGTVSRMLMCGSGNFVSGDMFAYLTSKYVPMQILQFEDILYQSPLCQHQTMVFNIIGSEQMCSDIVQFLNENRFKFYNNVAVIATDSSVAKLCVELLCVEKVIVSTKKSLLHDFG